MLFQIQTVSALGKYISIYILVQMKILGLKRKKSFFVRRADRRILRLTYTLMMMMGRNFMQQGRSRIEGEIFQSHEWDVRDN